MGYKYKISKLKMVLRLQLLIALVSIINQNIYSAAKIKLSRDSNAKDVHAQIVSAIRNNNKAKLNKLIKQERNTSNVLLALSELIRMGDRNGVEKLLIESGIDINTACKDGASALSIATMLGHIEIVKLLLELGADINITDKIGYTPLMWAAHNNWIKIAKLLIKERAGINIINSTRNANALKIACFKGNLNMVNLLLEHGSNYEVFSLKDIEFPGADTEKIKRDKVEIIKLLNQARVESERAKVVSGKKESKEPAAGNVPKESESSESYSSYLANHNSPVGNSPPFTQLYKGIDSGDIELVKKALKQIPDVNCKIKIFYPNNGRVYPVYPIFQAIPGKIEIVKLLIEDRADVNITHGKDSEIGLLTPIAFATNAGCDIETMNLLIESGADVNKTCNGYTPLHNAANEKIANLFINAGANIEAQSEDLYTPLHRAAEHGRQAVVDALIAAGANVRAQTKQGATPLSLAIANGHRGIVVSLLEEGIRLEPKEEAAVPLILNINGKSGDLIRNIIFKKIAIIDALLKMRRITEADINWQDSSGMNSIMWAVVRCPELVFKLLMYCRINLFQADLSLVNCKGQTALSLAVKHSKEDIVNCIEGYLLGRKDFLKNLLTTNGMTPKINDLITSYLFGQSNYESTTDKVENSAMHEPAVGIEQLLTYLSYANANTFNTEGKNQVVDRSDKKLNNLLSSISQKTVINIDKNITAKTESKEPVNALNSSSESMYGVNLELILAAKYDDKLLKELINQGVDVNVAGEDGKSAALMVAAYQGNINAVRILIDGKADINAKSKNGWTALKNAANQGHLEIVKMLIEAHADVNIPDKGGLTALIDSAYKGHTEIVQLLIDAGANIDYCTNKGNSALIVATMFGHVEIVQSLLKANADINISNIYDKQAIHYAKEKRLLDSIEVKKNKLKISQILSLHAIPDIVD